VAQPLVVFRRKRGLLRTARSPTRPLLSPLSRIVASYMAKKRSRLPLEVRQHQPAVFDELRRHGSGAGLHSPADLPCPHLLPGSAKALEAEHVLPIRSNLSTVSVPGPALTAGRAQVTTRSATVETVAGHVTSHLSTGHAPLRVER